MTQYANSSIIQLPAGMSILEACSRGMVPMNALVNTVNGVSPGGNPLVNGSDPCTVAQLLSNGNGALTARGVNVGPNGALNTQIFVDGTAAAAQTANGPTPFDTSALTEAPVTGATIASNVVLFTQYGG